MFSVQVKSKTIIKNINTIKKKLAPNTKLCAVVKANAYGFGATKISQLIEPLVNCFAVANLAEGITLRRAGIKKDILILGVTTDIQAAISNNLIITIGSLTAATELIKHHLAPRLHLAVNTGMNRFGINSLYELRAVSQLLANAKVEGLYTHLAYEADQLPQIETALAKFKKYIALSKKYFPNLLIHAGCSGVLNYPPAHFDMLRLGKALYGGIPGTETAFNVTSQVMAVQKIKSGDTVGYQGEFIAKTPMIIGIVHGGYAHGIQMSFSNTNFVTVDQKICPILGRICMDYFFIDVTHIDEPLGKKVAIITNNTGQTLLDVAQQTKLIPCNILLGLKQEELRNNKVIS